MRVLVLVLLVVGLMGLVGALQVLGRAARITPMEGPLRPLGAANRALRTISPPELDRLVNLVGETQAGDWTAAARLAAHLHALGIPIEDPEPGAVLAALHRLGPVER